MKALLIIALLLSPQLAYAATIKLNLIAVRGSNSMAPTELRELITDVRSLLANEGVKSKEVGYREVADPCPQYIELSKRVFRFNCLYLAFKAKGYLKADAYNYVIDAPSQQDGKFYIQGFTKQICSKYPYHKFAVSSAEMLNQDGEPRYLHSVLAMFHELLHLVGARHLSEPINNGMYPDALAHIDYKYLVTDTTKKQIKRCLG